MDRAIRYAATRGTVEDLILAKLRAGQYKEWQIEALAALGNPLFGGSQVPEWTKWEVRRNLLQKLPMRLSQEFAIIWAEKALPAFEAADPQDGRPRKAIEAAKARLRGEISVEECRKAARAADAAYTAAYADAAACAANAAYYAANAAYYAAYAAYAAAYAAYAAGWDWQIPALTSLILAWED